MNPDIPVVTSDPFSDEAVENAFSYDGELRDAAPVSWLEKYQCYFVGRHDLIKSILSDWRTFSSLSKPFDKGNSAIPQILVTDDPPEHTTLRNTLMKFMSPVALKQAHNDFVAVAEEQVSALLQRDVVDATQIASDFVLKVFPDYLGLPAEGRENLLPFGEAIFNSVGPNNERARESMMRAGPAFQWVMSQCAPGAVVKGRLADQIYTLPELGVVNQQQAGLLVASILAAGFDTTVLALTSALRAFAQYPEQWEVLQDPLLFKRAFEEALRYEPPVRFVARTLACDAEVGGVQLKKGDHMALSILAASRDPLVWSSPEVFDVRREPFSHLSFGAGIHACIGQALSRIEYSALFSVLARRVSRIELVGEPRRLSNNIANGWQHVPIRLIAS
ncbi:cytochrome P450 [Pseudomonas sp. UL073]|uniref:Cytochrome P450 n=1 Tax=Zestomonas insulae TaxID=2809017 RepID=A0ABS2IGS3_9GAMM|nr:cytochrome P450 [Pseudomonas insulae]MBM7061038.1 cytochrome P450 [Pseudomonas insulae]